MINEKLEVVEGGRTWRESAVRERVASTSLKSPEGEGYRSLAKERGTFFRPIKQGIDNVLLVCPLQAM